MKKNDYKCPEIENLKKLTDDFIKNAEEFVKNYKEGRGE